MAVVQSAGALVPVAGAWPAITSSGLASLRSTDRTAAYEAMLAEIADELDPAAGPSARTALFALDADDHRLVWLAHPVILDEPSWDVLCAAGAFVER